MTKLPPRTVLLPLVVLALIPSLLHAMPTQAHHGRAHLGIWQLKAQKEATVSLQPSTPALQLPTAPGTHTAYALDSQDELSLTVQGDTAHPESVTLSNALGLDHLSPKRPAQLRFRVRAEQAHLLPLTLQAKGKVFWSAAVGTRTEWQDVTLPLPTSVAKLPQVVLTLQLGAQTGTVRLADLRVEQP